MTRLPPRRTASASGALYAGVDPRTAQLRERFSSARFCCDRIASIAARDPRIQPMMIPTSSVAGMKMKCPAVTTSYRPPGHPLRLAQLGLDAPEPPPQHQHVDQQRAPHDDVGRRSGTARPAASRCPGSWSIGTYSSWAAVVAGACGACVRLGARAGAPACDEQQQEGQRACDAIQEGHV